MKKTKNSRFVLSILTKIMFGEILYEIVFQKYPYAIEYRIEIMANQRLI